MSEDPLVFVPVDKWGKLKNAFSNDWPRGIGAYILLDNMERMLKFGIDYGFKVYCPYGDISNGIVVKNIKDKLYEIVIQSPSDDTEKLFQALMTTELIDWKRSVHVPYATKQVMDCVRQVIQDKKLWIRNISLSETFIYDKSKPPFEDVRLPADFSFKHLSLEYVELANSTWPHKYTNSSWYYNLLIRAKLGYGLFKGDEIIAWVFVREMGALGHLYTIESHRRKGYGELVLKLISNILLQQDQHVVAYCLKGNDSAFKLYEKLGFQYCGELEWYTFSSLPYL